MDTLKREQATEIIISGARPAGVMAVRCTVEATWSGAADVTDRIAEVDALGGGIITVEFPETHETD